MTEWEPGEAGIDGLLRRTMAAPVPNLPPDFDQRLMRKLRGPSPLLHRYRRILLAGYGLISAVTSAAVMRGQGLNWGIIALTIVGPLAFVAAGNLLRVRSRRSG